MAFSKIDPFKRSKIDPCRRSKIDPLKKPTFEHEISDNMFFHGSKYPLVKSLREIFDWMTTSANQISCLTNQKASLKRFPSIDSFDL